MSLKESNIFMIFLILTFLCSSCSKQTSNGQSTGNFSTFRSSDSRNTHESLTSLSTSFAFDTKTGVFYYKDGKVWKASNPEVKNFKHLKSVVANEGQIISTKGYTFPGDGGASKFKVYKKPPFNKSDKVNIIKLSNGLYAARLFEGKVNVISFGAKGDSDQSGNGTDNTKAFQNAIDFINQNGGGELYIPSSLGKFFKISKIYIKNGVKLSGDASSVSTEFKSLIGSKILVDNKGQGIIIGEDEFFPTKGVKGIVVENLIIKGLKNSISGIRCGSDISFVTPVNIIVRNCIIEGFTNPGVAQTVYDMSNKALGKAEDNYRGAFPVTGACGVFIAGGVIISLDNVISQKNYYGLYESSGGTCTALNISSGSFSENIKNGIVFTSLKSATLNSLVVVATNKEAGIKIIAPKTNIDNIKNGPTNIYINNIHLESNNFKRGSGYSIIIDNQNEDGFIKNVFINNNRLDFSVYDGIYIHRGKNINIESNSILVLPSRTQLKTVDCEYIEYSGVVFGNMDIDAETDIIRKNKKQNKLAGGIIADYRTCTTKREGIEESLIIQGDIALLPETINAVNGVFKIEAWGKINANTSQRALKFKFNKHVISTNNYTPKKATTWYTEIVIPASSKPNVNLTKILTLLQIGEHKEAPQISKISEKELWKKINRIYITGKSAPGNLTLEGYQVSFKSY